ncbi:hypothetical protein [Desulfoluna butyratoxydans]|uniref:hypothetical protein n=1 Tax=Desulfoluna butyratoxydans TaxID=231438 RepID=UPI0015D1E63B|nr:hypothetical protein [Desulfoluna butyratoxydans]
MLEHKIQNVVNSGVFSDVVVGVLDSALKNKIDSSEELSKFLHSELVLSEKGVELDPVLIVAVIEFILQNL